MADLIKEVKEEESETEIDTSNLQETASSSNERKRKNTDQSNGLDSQIKKPTWKVKSTVQQNADRNKKGKKSTILVFYQHPQNKKKNENGPMADQETLEDSSNISDDSPSKPETLEVSSNISDDSPSKPVCPPGAQDAEPSAVTPGNEKAE